MATGSPSTSLPRRVGGILGIALVLQTTGLASLAVAAPDSPRVLVVPFLSGEGATEKQAQKFSTLVLEDLKTRDELSVVQPEAGKKPAAKESLAPVSKGGGGPQVAEKAL